ncbi:uncharacterized protein LOC110870339 [Helianthus annuus]|uniref:uncharacterized protein LOC110870339 n=1 Tax=Helianthus annuus TaxID=4232 RepID=UPI000B8F2262|nr:uncharacterized protein LOC110870339 [Helianthus annuus]
MKVLYEVKFRDGEDVWTWKSYENNNFSVAEIRDQIIRRSEEIEDEWRYWNRWVPPKVNLFSWRIAMGRIPVKTELIKRGVQLQNQVCCRCDAYDESVEHLVLSCTMSKSIWWNILAWVKLPVSTQLGSSKELLKQVDSWKGSKVWKKVINLILQTTIWHIWKARNEQEFKGTRVSGSKVVEEIKADSFIWLKSRSKFENINWVRWVDFNVKDIIH